MSTCGAIDPVNDPAYNMRGIIKQSILLEEHLAEDRKYCKACICKHFLHIIGLAEEAVWLANTNVGKYPYLQDSVEFYTNAFNAWLVCIKEHGYGNKRNAKEILAVLADLRDRRRKLIDAYYLT